MEAKAALRVVLDAFKRTPLLLLRSCSLLLTSFATALNNLFVNTSGRDFWGDLVRPHVESARLAEISRLEDSLGTPATDAAGTLSCLPFSSKCSL